MTRDGRHRKDPRLVRMGSDGSGPVGGQGSSVIAGQRFNWRRGDFFAVPPWTWHEHANAGDEPAILFSIQDIPVFEALGLYREEAYADHGGHQLVTSVFEG